MLENWADAFAGNRVVAFQELENQQLMDGLHQHSSYELVYVTRGRGDWQIGSEKGEFQQGSLLIYPPRTLHAWRAEAGTRVSVIVLRFRPEALPGSLLKLSEMKALQDFLLALKNPLKIQVSDRERLSARLRSIDRAHGVLSLARFYVGLELVAGFRFTQVTDKEGISSVLSPRDLARLERAKRFVEERFRESPTRAQGAEAVGLDEAAFSRFFRRASGVTFSSYLANAKVRHAAALLGSRRDLGVAEVAKLSGFGSLASMHRQFKRRLGTTPDSYRRAANAEMLEP